MALLAPQHRLIVPDLRGLGDSSRPRDGYDKKTVAADLWQLLSGELGLTRWHLVGHDWGGPVAFALAAAHADAIRTLTIVDVTLPGIGPDISQGGKRWHHAFHMTPDLPEALVAGPRAHLPELVLRGLLVAARRVRRRRHRRVPAHLQPARRAARRLRLLPQHPARHRRQPQPRRQRLSSADAGARVGGARAEARGRGSEPEQSLRVIADDVHGVVIADSGHFVPEEQPEALAAHLLEHFKRG